MDAFRGWSTGRRSAWPLSSNWKGERGRAGQTSAEACLPLGGAPDPTSPGTDDRNRFPRQSRTAILRNAPGRNRAEIARRSRGLRGSFGDLLATDAGSPRQTREECSRTDDALPVPGRLQGATEHGARRPLWLRGERFARCADGAFETEDADSISAPRTDFAEVALMPNDPLRAAHRRDVPEDEAHAGVAASASPGARESSRFGDGARHGHPVISIYATGADPGLRREKALIRVNACGALSQPT